MHTLFDFVTQVKTVEYLLAISAIAVFLIYWEVLKPRPFRTLMRTTREDMDHIKKSGGFRAVSRKVALIAVAPFIGLAYLVALPFAFVFALGNAAFKGVASLAGGTASFGWRPTEAYLSGKKESEKDSSESIKDGKE
jgi:hypothetical protein